MRTKHTPGLWVAAWTHNDGQNLEAAQGWHVYAGDPETNGEPVICDIPDGSRIDGCRAANARLIAAAPDLLAACDEADTALAVINLTCELTPQARASLRNAWAKVNAAMAAATGTADRFLIANPDYKRGEK
jgi:hypothetical protein